MADSAGSNQTRVVTAKDGSGTGSGDLTAFVVLPIFFLLGLLGVLICYILKRKGYRCTTDAEDEEEVQNDPQLAPELNDTFSENDDTVGQIIHCIMKNEANSEALKAMIPDGSIDSDGPPLTPVTPGSPSPPQTPISPGAPPGAAKHTCSHLHTIGGLGGHKNICTRCSQKKWPLMRKQPRRAEPRRSHHEVTVLTVGRFRVTKSDPRDRSSASYRNSSRDSEDV